MSFLFLIFVNNLHKIKIAMILELKVRNFLSFKEETTLSFEATADKTLEDYYVVQKTDGTRILKMMMVYGANASGKSNLIAALDFINGFVHSIPEDKDEDTGFIPFRFVDSISDSGEFDLWFYVGEDKYRYTLVISESAVQREVLYNYPGTQPAIVFNRELDIKMNISSVNFGNKIKISGQATEAVQLKTLNNTSVFAAYNQVNVAVPEIEAVLAWFKDQFLEPIMPNTSLSSFSDSAVKNDDEIKQQALNFLKEADFNITDVLFEDRVREVPDFIIKTLDSAPISDAEKKRIRKERVMHYDEKFFEHRIVNNNVETRYTLEADMQSLGTLRYYNLSAPFFLALTNNSFLPIDEIGSSIHPLLVIHFIREFLRKSKEAQLLFTTHNMSILNEKEILRKDAIWFCDKQEDGSTDLFSMSDFPIRKELSYYNAYKLGKFGGIPEL